VFFSKVFHTALKFMSWNRSITYHPNFPHFYFVSELSLNILSRDCVLVLPQKCWLCCH